MWIIIMCVMAEKENAQTCQNWEILYSTQCTFVTYVQAVRLQHVDLCKDEYKEREAEWTEDKHLIEGQNKTLI